MELDDDALPDLFEAVEEESTWEAVLLGDNAPDLELQPTVAAVWGSSRNMSCFLCAHPELIRGQRVVELGAGAGLPSLVAASLGAEYVVTTDADKYSVEAMSRAVEHNRLSHLVVSERLDWTTHEDCAAAAHNGNGWPVVLAADCNYTTKAVTPLLRTIDALLASPGVLLLASREQRFGLSDCLERLAADPASTHGGVGLRLERVLTFSDDGDHWAPAQGAAAANGEADSSEGEAAHKLWIFRRDAPPDDSGGGGGDALYFEPQRLMRCACHALNNLLGRAAFSPAALDEIAISLGGSTYSLEHRWPLVGNYDVSVVLSALSSCGLDASWWDARKPMSELVHALAGPDVVGALVNVQSFPRLLGGLVPLGRHWAALRRLGTRWADVDSNLAGGPLMLDGEEALHGRLNWVHEQGGHVFVVRRLKSKE